MKNSDAALRLVEQYRTWLGPHESWSVARVLDNLAAELRGEGLNAGTPHGEENCTIQGLREQLRRNSKAITDAVVAERNRVVAAALAAEQAEAAASPDDARAPAAVPLGWKLMPSSLNYSDAHDGMMRVLLDLENGKVSIIDAYAAMLAAAPDAPAAQPTEDINDIRDVRDTFGGATDCDAARTAQPTDYELRNPLGGPAKVFDACADLIRAGDSVERAMALFGLAWAAPAAQPVEPSLNEAIDFYTGKTGGPDKFNKTILHEAVTKFPQHADGLRRYSVVQLTSRQATREEVEAQPVEPTDDARDAARYRWLTQAYSGLFCSNNGRSGPRVTFADSLQQPEMFLPQMLDTAIDAAMRAAGDKP